MALRMTFNAAFHGSCDCLRSSVERLPTDSPPSLFRSGSAAVEDRKLFIGMVSKKYGENEIRMMFSSFGQIEECRILRGPDGQSRGRCTVSGDGAAPPPLSPAPNLHTAPPQPKQS